MRNLLIFFLILNTSMMHAELISGPANIRIAANKEVIISLYDSVFVECSELKDNWYNIIISINYSGIDYPNRQYLKKGDKLFNEDNKEIGIVENDVPNNICEIYSSGIEEGNLKISGIYIHCCTNKDNIYPKSIIENQVFDLINQNKQLNLSLFSKLFNDFGIKQIDYLKDTYPNLVEYHILDNYYDAPRDRIRFIFDDNILIALVYSRKMNFENIQIYELLEGKEMAIFKLPEKTSLHDFIEKNKNIYQGGD